MVPSCINDTSLADGVAAVLPSRDKQGRHIILLRPGNMSQLFRSLSVAEKFFCGLNLHIGTIHLPVGYTEDPFPYSHNALKHVVHIKLIYSV